MWTIDNIDLKNNPKFNSGFKDILGNEGLENAKIDIEDVRFSKRNKSISVDLSFTEGKQVSIRTWTLQWSDMTKAEKNWVLGILDDIKTRMKKEPELLSANEVV